MKAYDYMRILGTLALCQVMAPLMILDLPSIKKITVKSVTVREPHVSHAVTYMGPDLRPTTYSPLQEGPGNKTTFAMESSDGKESIILDHEDLLLFSMNPSYWYSSGYYGGSGDLGVVIFGLPGIILASPILAVNSIFWYLVKLNTGMNRHALSFYLRVMNQLDGDARYLLKSALKKL